MRGALLLVLALVAASAQAQGQARERIMAGPSKVHADPGARAAELELALTVLASARNETAARMATDNLWTVLHTAPDAKAADLMNRAIRERSGYNLEKAASIAATLTDHAPAWEEAWNQRSYVAFLRRRYDESVTHCAEALALQPKHLGCLTGMARIYTRHLRHPVRARELLDRAVALNPWIYERRLYDELRRPD